MKKEKININLSAEEQPTVKRLKEMAKSENKIEEAAKQKVIENTEGLAEFTKLTGDLTAGTELGNLIKRMFIAGAKSEEAKEYHTKGMYTLTEASVMFSDMVRHITEGELRKWGVGDFEKFIQSRTK